MIKLLFILYCQINIFAINSQATDSLKPGKSKDTTYRSKEFKLKKILAKSIIESIENLNLSSRSLSSDELKKTAISYALLGQVTESANYAERYIKASHEVNILDHEAFEAFVNSDEYRSLIKKYKPEINGWILFFFSCGLIGVFLSIVINLRRKGDTLANLMITLFLFFNSLFIIHLCLYLSKFSFYNPHVLYISTPFSFIYGPLLYFYFKRISEKYRFKRIDLLHLIPTVLLIGYLLPIYLLSAEEKLHLMYNRDEVLHSILTWIVLIKYVSLITYAFLAFRLFKKRIQKRKKLHKQIIRWQRNMVLLYVSYVFFYIIYGIAILNMVDNNLLFYPQIFSMALIILYVGYIAYVQPRVFSKKYLFQDVTFFKYKKSGLTNSYSEELKDKLFILLNEEKVFKGA
ncbi:MAG: hypothetical protein GKR88_18835 [Flavobacteriaceae bacterium]|nr:MAG: hypothetical protein GKR88_18835 [Flavobacteriaceae bacterium]